MNVFIFIFKDMVHTFKFICMHPEVKIIGFLMLLYAGTIFNLFFKDFNYYSLNTIVGILKFIIGSAGLKIDSKYLYFKTSETRRNKISCIEKIKDIPKNKLKQIK